VNAPVPDSHLQLASSVTEHSFTEAGGHQVQLYTDDAFLLNVLRRFIGGALVGGDSAVVVATKAHHEGLARRLQACGLDAARAIRENRYILLDAEEALRLEQLWNKLGRSHSFFLLCAYPITGFNNETHVEPFLKMCREHSSVLPSEAYFALSSEEERLRTIAELEQKAHILETQISLQHSEQRFRLLVEAVQDYAIFMLDPQGHISSWNAGAQRIKGYRADEIIGQHFSIFYPEQEKKNQKPQYELKEAARLGRFEDEGWRVRKDGSKFWANVIITALRDPSGELVGYAKVTRDFSERRQTQIALQKEIAQRRDAEKRLHESENSLRALTLHLLRTQDEERRRIGRDLHDSLGQYLAALKMKLDTLASAPAVNGFNQDIAQCIRMAEDSIREVRTISYLMYPPMLDEMGLRSAIAWYLEGFSARSGIKANLEVYPEFRRISRDAELALFRVLQESLVNVHRHSGSETAQVRIFVRDGMAVLEVEDQGKGMPEAFKEFGSEWAGSHGVGLRGMSERVRQLGGKLEVESSPRGTILRAIVPEQQPSSATAKIA
jgi:PAS domain S-box-containing protein